MTSAPDEPSAEAEMSAATSESVISSAPFREESQWYARPCGLAREKYTPAV